MPERYLVLQEQDLEKLQKFMNIYLRKGTLKQALGFQITIDQITGRVTYHQAIIITDEES